MRTPSTMILSIAFALGVLRGIVFPSGGLAQDATPAACAATTEEENEALARRWYDDLWNPRDAAAIDLLLSPDHVHHWAMGPDTEGIAAFTERIQTTWEALPSQYTVDFAVTEDDLVVLRWHADGNHVAAFGGIEPTGNPVTFTGVNIFRIACGQIAEVWSELDGVGLIRQMTGDTSAAGASGSATPPASAPSDCSAATEADNLAVARAWHEEVINRRNPDALADLLSPTVVHHAAGGYPQLLDAAGVTAMMGDFLTAFPDLHYSFDDFIVEDDYVVERYTATGTQEGALGDLAPSGQPATWSGINIFRLECGQIAEVWSEVDAVGRRQQLTADTTATPTA